MSAWWHDDPCEDKPGNDGKGHDKGNGQGHHYHGNGNGFGHDHCPPCFAEGTLLQMSDGSVKRVEDIRVGDRVRTSSGINTEVMWVGSSEEHDATYGIYHPDFGQPVVVTKNHGVAVRMTDGSRGLAAAKFLTEAQYGDFMVARISGGTTKVYHIMLEAHELVLTDGGLVSESYFCGGWETFPEAEDALLAARGRERHAARALPRVRRRDVDEVMEIERAA